MPFPRPPGIFRGGRGASGTPQRPWTRVTATPRAPAGTTQGHGKLFAGALLTAQTIFFNLKSFAFFQRVLTLVLLCIHSFLKYIS